MSRHGRAITFVGGSGAILAVGGKCTAGNIGLWDSASPAANSCIGRLTHHSATVNTLCTLPGGWLLASGDAAGGLSLTDVRMLGNGDVRVLWKVRGSKSSINSVVTMRLKAATEYPRAMALGAAQGASAVLVTAGNDGALRVWQPSTGRLIQSIEEDSHSHPMGTALHRRKLHLGGAAGFMHSSGISSLAVCEDGVVSCGGDGVVRLYSALDGTMPRVDING